MTDTAATSLAERFAALQAERDRTWPEAKLRANAGQRRLLVARFDPARAVEVGDAVGDFVLETAAGGRVTAADLLADGPVALIVFRFAGCPACNIALPHYDATLVPALARRGIRVVAVTPQLPERGAGAITDRHHLSYPVLSDRGNALARRLGLAFRPTDDVPPVPADPGWIGALTGTGTGELPMPAMILLDRAGTVRFVDISPDWLARTEADAVIAAADALVVGA